MKINNYHVGWFLAVLIGLSPYWYQIFSGNWYMFNDTPVSGFLIVLGIIGWLELGALGITLLVIIGASIVGMINGDIDFEWEIKLPSKQSTKDKELFMKLGSLDPESEDWKIVYAELNSRGKFG